MFYDGIKFGKAALALVLLFFCVINSGIAATQDATPMTDTNIEPDLRIDGVLLEYFLTAYHDFSVDQKNLHDFRVTFKYLGEDVEIVFVPKRVPNEPPVLGGRTSLGRAVQYHISKSNGKILRKSYFR